MSLVRIGVAALTGAALFAPLGAGAQEIELRARSRVLVGTVTDRAGQPVDAEVYLSPGKERTTAGADGRFRFTDVKAGTYEIGARRVGFYPQHGEIQVPDTGAVIEIVMSALPNKLPPVVTSASRGGLSGVVGDTGYRVIQGVQIEVVAANKFATTDSAGEFYIDVKPGKHMVRVSRDGFASRFVSVTVPRDSGRRMQVFLTPATRASTRMDAAAIRMLDQRLMRRNAVYSSLFTREDLEKSGLKSLQQVAASGAVQYVDPSCWVTLPAFAESEGSEASLAGRVPLWLLDAADLEFVEVYASRNPRQVQKSIRAGPTTTRNPPRTCPQIIAWLRK